MNIQIFNNEDFGEIRILGDWENPLFCLSDVCKALELDASAVMRRLEDGVISSHPIIDKLGRTQNANFVNEDGLYDVILDSRKPEAKKFRKWITSEVLPSIRKTGGYSIQNNYSPYTPAANAVSDTEIPCNKIQQLFIGVQRSIALAQAIDIAEKAHNIPLQSLKQLLSPAEHNTGYLNPTQLGEKLGGLPAKVVNAMLAQEDLQYKDDKDWRLTENGKVYGEEMPYTRNGHSGYQIRWNKDVLEVLEK